MDTVAGYGSMVSPTTATVLVDTCETEEESWTPDSDSSWRASSACGSSRARGRHHDPGARPWPGPSRLKFKGKGNALGMDWD